MMKHLLFSLLLIFTGHAFCGDIVYKDLRIGAKVDIPHSEFCVASIGALGNDDTQQGGWENCLLFSKKDDSFQIVIDRNIRTFSIYYSSDTPRYFAISNNGASRQSIISIYKIEDKKPFLRKVYQTAESKKERTQWEITEWTADYVMMKCYGEESGCSSKRVDMKTLK